MQERNGPRPLRVACFFTRFPHRTETFLQREVRALRGLGLELDLYSFHGSGPAEFEGLPVRRFSKWRLLALCWRVPVEWFRRPAEVTVFARLLFLTAPRDWLNQWENLYGAGIAAVWAARFRRAPVDHIHAAWASLPAMVAWILSRLNGTPFSFGAHAYDLFEHGGDWLLAEKSRAACFVHTSTMAGVRRLEQVGVPAARIVLARRGLDRLPECRPLRPGRTPLRILCVARLVEKKGLLLQLRLYAAFRRAGLKFFARIIGDGPLRPRLEAEIRGLHLRDRVTLTGPATVEDVWRALGRADVLVHTGIIAASGDRDGLPNVVPEAMAAGVLVATAPGEGVLEAVRHEETGLVLPLEDPEAWERGLRRIQTDDAFADRLRCAARRWVEENFDARINASLLVERMRQSAACFDPQAVAAAPEEVRA